MKSLVDKIIKMGSRNLADKLQGDEQLMRQVMSMFGILSDLYGPTSWCSRLESWMPSTCAHLVKGRILRWAPGFRGPTDKVRKPDGSKPFCRT